MIRRPTGISVLALLNLVSAVLALVGVTAVAAWAIANDFPLDLVAVFVVVMAIAIAFAVVVFWGLWTLRSWARTLTIVLSAIGLINFPVGTIIDGLVIWYLFQPHVKEAFAAGPIKFLFRKQTDSNGKRDTKPEGEEQTSKPFVEPPPAALANAWLVDELSGESYQLRQGDTRLGRGSGNDLTFPDSTISREHALVREQNGLFTLYDRASTYGTQVNDQRVQGPMMLENGDVIQIGETRLQLVCRE